MRYCTVSDRTEFRVESVPHQSAKTFVLACCTWQLIVIPLWSLRADLNLPCRDFPIQTDTFLFSSLPVFLSLTLSCSCRSPARLWATQPALWSDLWPLQLNRQVRVLETEPPCVSESARGFSASAAQQIPRSDLWPPHTETLTHTHKLNTSYISVSPPTLPWFDL